VLLDFFGKRSVKVIADPDLAAELPTPTLRGGWLFKSHEPRNGFACPGQNDLLAALDPLEQAGKVGFGFVDVDGFHGAVLGIDELVY